MLSPGFKRYLFTEDSLNLFLHPRHLPWIPGLYKVHWIFIFPFGCIIRISDLTWMQQRWFGDCQRFVLWLTVESWWERHAQSGTIFPCSSLLTSFLGLTYITKSGTSIVVPLNVASKYRMWSSTLLLEVNEVILEPQDGRTTGLKQLKP